MMKSNDNASLDFEKRLKIAELTHNEMPEETVPKLYINQNFLRCNSYNVANIQSKRVCNSKMNTFAGFKFKSSLLLIILFSFCLGLILGVLIVSPTRKITKSTEIPITLNKATFGVSRTLNSYKDNVNYLEINAVKKSKVAVPKYSPVVFINSKHKDNVYSDKNIYPESLTDIMKNILKDNNNEYSNSLQKIDLKKKKENVVPTEDAVLYNNIYWGPKIEQSLPKGYTDLDSDIWRQYTDQAEIVKMESGCGRMQNRLVTFSDGLQACVRYRQNTDQIQGEIFSFYLGRLLNLTNLAPSVVKIVNIKERLWKNVAEDIINAQWSNNRAVILTQYIPSLESANIPDILRPSNRHLNKFDVMKICLSDNATINKESDIFDKIMNRNKIKTKDNITIRHFDAIDMNLTLRTKDKFIELAQWSDLIIFDYLTANLDRIVNNLFNYQWNINIMNGPAHNLARKTDNKLLVFLDNESGLLHGYRLLKKYNIYHSLMLDNLCVFRRSTIDLLQQFYELKNVGAKIIDMFHSKNNIVIRDILPPLPEKNIKILVDRIGKVLNQVDKCIKGYS